MRDLYDYDIHSFGNTSMLAGVIYTGRPNVIFWLPAERTSEPLEEVEMNEKEWKEFIDQTDQVHTEIVVGPEKAIVRKCLRVIDQNISWQCYERDGFRCRYCGRSGIPLTVDHIDLWEKGGATVAINLITACKKCNKNRGNMSYADWLNSPEYQIASRGLTHEQKQINADVLTTIPHLETLRVKTIKSR